MNCRILLLLFWIVAGATSPAYAVWIGKGEVVGQVESSKFFGDGVQFVLAIESQKTDGPILADLNTFVYYGRRHEAVSAGDRLHLRVNKGGVPRGIHVESIEFIADQPGSPLGVMPTAPSQTELLVVLGLVGGLALIVYLAVRSNTNRTDREAAA
jgi:hypothetical protein